MYRIWIIMYMNRHGIWSLIKEACNPLLMILHTCSDFLIIQQERHSVILPLKMHGSKKSGTTPWMKIRLFACWRAHAPRPNGYHRPSTTYGCVLTRQPEMCFQHIALVLLGMLSHICMIQCSHDLLYFFQIGRLMQPCCSSAFQGGLCVAEWPHLNSRKSMHLEREYMARPNSEGAQTHPRIRDGGRETKVRQEEGRNVSPNATSCSPTLWSATK